MLSLPAAPAQLFSATMTAEQWASQMNELQKILDSNFNANTNQHQEIKDTILEIKGTILGIQDNVSVQTARVSTVQLGLDSALLQARQALERVATLSHGELEGVRAECLAALNEARARHEADLTGVFNSLVGGC